ncbi:MAG: PepSY-associated TM helix domain-containing protein, partial [Acidobacteria bacterium]|nr:PepSY-associated TM helix domain-containing protein [Acidobacteriota bacterium]
DLHKGRDTGPAWSLFLDISAGLMAVVSFTGLVLMWFLQRKRMAGFVTMAAGALACYLVYVIWVP